MGNCQYCGKSIKIINYEEDCPACGKPPYTCWNCYGDVRGGKECPACHFFICKHCGECGFNCQLEYLIKETEGKTPKEIILLVLNWKQGKIRANCPKGVGISYAKGKLGTMALKLKGYYTKDNDKEEFQSRIDEIENFSIGKTWTIGEIKEDGYYGIEYREASNLGICMGWAKKTIKKNKEDYEYEVFTRINGERCRYTNWNKLKINQCPICKKTYNFTGNVCGNFDCRYKKGKEKGNLRKLKSIKSGCDFCSLPRKDFIKKDDDVKDGNCRTL